jgi:hypothetical protein
MFFNDFDNFNSESLKLSWTRFGVSASLNVLNEDTERVETPKWQKKTAQFLGRLTYNQTLLNIVLFD